MFNAQIVWNELLIEVVSRMLIEEHGYRINAVTMADITVIINGKHQFCCELHVFFYLCSAVVDFESNAVSPLWTHNKDN